MDARRFAALTKTVLGDTTRRRVLGLVIGGLLGTRMRGESAAKKGNKRKRKTCRVGQTTAFCGGRDVVCTTSSGEVGQCHTTTGQAPYCAASGNCFACESNADCVDVCGPGAACVACADGCPETGGTGCLGVSSTSCSI
jgi:hypothetical protein